MAYVLYVLQKAMLYEQPEICVDAKFNLKLDLKTMSGNICKIFFTNINASQVYQGGRERGWGSGVGVGRVTVVKINNNPLSHLRGLNIHMRAIDQPEVGRFGHRLAVEMYPSATLKTSSNLASALRPFPQAIREDTYCLIGSLYSSVVHTLILLTFN